MSSDGAPSAEAGRRRSQETPPPKSHQHHRRHRHRSRRHPSELPAAADDVENPQPVEESRAGAGAVIGRRVDKCDGRGHRERTSDTRENGGSSGHPRAHSGDHARDEGHDGSSSGGGGGGGSSSSSTASEGSGTLWVRVTPTDENSSEEENLSYLPSPESATVPPWRGREDLLRRYLGGGGDGGETETPGGSSNRAGSRTANAKAQPERIPHTCRSSSSGAARGTVGAGASGTAGTGIGRSSSPDRSDGEAHRTPDEDEDEEWDEDGDEDETGPVEEGHLHHSDSENKQRPGIKGRNRLGRMLATELAAAENEATSGSGIADRSRAAGPLARPIKRAEGEGPLPERLACSPRAQGSEEGGTRARAESGKGWGGRAAGLSAGLSIAAARARKSN